MASQKKILKKKSVTAEEKIREFLFHDNYT